MEYSSQDQRILDTAIGVFQNYNFLESMKNTLIFGTVLTVVFSIVSRGLQYLYLTRKIRLERESVEV